MLKPGDAAPDFVLKDPNRADVRLSGFSGRPVVLYFYPKDGTAGCTMEAKKFRDNFEEIAALGAVVLGISLDPPESHCEFRDRHEIPFPLLSDPEGRVHDLYGAWRTTLFGRNPLGVRRCTYLIGPDGIIREVYRNVNMNLLGHARQVIRDLQRFASEKWELKLAT
ncbi:MAG: peroxiredoxin [Thermoplasmatota archaeon]